MAVVAIVLLGAFWIALGFLGFAIFILLAPLTGVPGAAAITAAIFLVLVAFGALLLSRKIESARQTALLAGLASTGGARLLMGLVAKHPLLSLGIGGALAAFFLRGSPSSKS
jgi:nitric oxide reductase large subunit